jgi:RNA polymerase sigma-70 factor (ECF subfamily)
MAGGSVALTSPTLLGALWDPNNEAAWRTFLQRYQPLIDNWCRRRGLQDQDAEDVTATVLSRLVKEMRRFVYDPQHRFRGWLKTVVHREVCNFLRRKARRPGDWASGDPRVYEVMEALEAPAAAEELAGQLSAELEEHAQRAVTLVRGRVEPHTWQAFWLTAIEQMPPGDVARRLGMTYSAVCMAKRRVGLMLREEGAASLQVGAGGPKG